MQRVLTGIVRQHWDEHISGKRNWQYKIWNILMFQRGLKKLGVMMKLLFVVNTDQFLSPIDFQLPSLSKAGYTVHLACALTSEMISF